MKVPKCERCNKLNVTIKVISRTSRILRYCNEVCRNKHNATYHYLYFKYLKERATLWYKIKQLFKRK